MFLTHAQKKIMQSLSELLNPREPKLYAHEIFFFRAQLQAWFLSILLHQVVFLSYRTVCHIIRTELNFVSLLAIFFFFGL